MDLCEAYETLDLKEGCSTLDIADAMQARSLYFEAKIRRAEFEVERTSMIKALAKVGKAYQVIVSSLDATGESQQCQRPLSQEDAAFSNTKKSHDTSDKRRQTKASQGRSKDPVKRRIKNFFIRRLSIPWPQAFRTLVGKLFRRDATLYARFWRGRSVQQQNVMVSLQLLLPVFAVGIPLLVFQVHESLNRAPLPSYRIPTSLIISGDTAGLRQVAKKFPEGAAGHPYLAPVFDTPYFRSVVDPLFSESTGGRAMFRMIDLALAAGQYDLANIMWADLDLKQRDKAFEGFMHLASVVGEPHEIYAYRMSGLRGIEHFYPDMGLPVSYYKALLYLSDDFDTRWLDLETMRLLKSGERSINSREVVANLVYVSERDIVLFIQSGASIAKSYLTKTQENYPHSEEADFSRQLENMLAQELND